MFAAASDAFTSPGQISVVGLGSPKRPAVGPGGRARRTSAIVQVMPLEH